MLRIPNLTYDASLALFECLVLDDYTQIKRMILTSSIINRHELVTIFVSYLVDQNPVGFRSDKDHKVIEFVKQTEVFLGALVTITMLRQDAGGVPFYSPRGRDACLCKLGSSIIRQGAPNFYRNPRSVYDYVNSKFSKSTKGMEALQKGETLSNELKIEQVNRLMRKYKVIKEVRDFDGVEWVETQ